MKMFVLAVVAAFWTTFLASLAQADDMLQRPVLTTAGDGEVDLQEDEREVRNLQRHLRFVVKKHWDFNESQGIYFAASKDKKFQMIVALLDEPKEIPVALAEVDQLIPVRQTKLGDPTSGVHRGIPTEVLLGQGIAARTGLPVEISILTMAVADKVVLATFFVDSGEFKKHAPKVKRVIESFALLMTPDEAKKLEKAKKRNEQEKKTE